MRQLSRNPATHVAFDATGERIVAFLRARHPHKWPESVAAETGIKATTLRKLAERGSRPGFAVLTRLASAYGPELLHAVWPGLTWLDRLASEEREARLEAKQAAIEAELRELRSAR